MLDGSRLGGHFMIAVIAHYGYQYLAPVSKTDPDKTVLFNKFETSHFVASSILGFLMFISVFTVMINAFESLDQKFEDPEKRKSIPKWAKKLPPPRRGSVEPTFQEMMPKAVKNIGILFVIVQVIGLFLDFLVLRSDEMAEKRHDYHLGWLPESLLFHKGDTWFYRTSEEGVVRSMGMFTLFILTGDIFFYSGHLAMHRIKSLRASHALHHSSWARRAVAGYYMDTVDFLLEHGSVFIGMFVWRECGPCWSVTLCIGAFNILVTHSGWDIPGLPDPREHYLHHSTYNYNFGLFLDHVFNTSLSWDAEAARKAKKTG